MENKIRVIQYGVGPIGSGMVKLMLQKPVLQIVGAVDNVNPALLGVDLGKAVGLDRNLGIPIVKELKDALPSGGADIVLHSTWAILPEVADEFIECMRAGLSVISNCEELCFPYRKHPELSAKLDAVAHENKVVLLGTGVNPGFAMDKLVLTLATACQQVTKVKVQRIVDASRRRLALQKMVGVGLTLEEFAAQVAAGTVKHHGLPESAGMISQYLGLEVDTIDEIQQPLVAERALRSQYIDVPVGRVRGIRQVAVGTKDNEEKIRLELEIALDTPESFDFVKISGIPNLEMKIPGGIHGDIATSAIAVNCIPAVFRLRPGLRVAHDVSMCYFPGHTIHARAASAV